MDWGYNKASYFREIDRIKNPLPLLLTSMSSSNEEEEDFNETLELSQNIRSDDFFSFRSSPQKGT